MPSGSTSVKVTDWNTLKFTWELKGSSSSSNGWEFTIGWKMQLIATSDGYISSSATKRWSVTIGGKEYSGTNTIGISNNTTKTLASGTVELFHNRLAGPTFSFDYSFSQQFDMNFNGWVGTKSGSGTGEVPIQASKSSLTVSNGTLGTAQTLAIGRQANTLTHTITYKCGTASGTITSNTTSESVSWTPPLSLAQQNKTGTSVTATLTLTTYFDGTSIGSNAYTISLAIPASVKPTCSMTLEDVSGVDDIYGSPVQNLSKIKITITGTGAQGSTITSYKATCDGKTYTGATVTTALLQKAGSSPVVITVTDSRGRQGTASYTMNVQAYTAPAITDFKVIRCDQDGTENDRGDYAKVTFSARVSSMSSKNLAAYNLRYKKSSAETYTEIALGNLTNMFAVTNYSRIIAADGNESYDIEVEVVDAHHTTVRTSSVSTAFTLMNWGANGTSIGIGKVAEGTNNLSNALSFVQEGNRYAFSSPGVAGSAGYVLMAQIVVTAANADTPISFVFTRRTAETPMSVHVCLSNSTATTSSLRSIRYEGSNYGAFLVPRDALTWELYIQKVSAYDTITLQDWWMSKTMESRVKVTFPGTLVSNLPNGWYRATPPVIENILDTFFPVGYILMLYNHNDPNTMYPGSKWVRIENAFLWATTATGTIAQTGGEREVKLTTEQLPAHSHGSVYSQHATGTKNLAWYTASGSSMAYGPVETGSGQAHNNMPPYIQVSVWRRTE